MRDFAKISTTIWNSRKFRSLPNDDARLVYLYLHTNPHVNSLGCYVLPFGYALSDLGWNDMDSDPIRYRKAIEALCDSGLIGFDKAESLVRIVDFLKHSPFMNEKHAKGAIKILYQIPCCAEKELLIKDLRVMKHVPASLFGEPADSLSKGSRYTETETETETRDQEIRGRRIGASAENDLPVPDDATWREQVLDAIGVSSSGITGPSKMRLGDRADMDLVGRWMTDLGLTEDRILAVLRETAADKRDGPPSSLKYFTKAMQREAARLAEAPLQPASPREVNHDRQPARDRREAAADDRLRRRLDAASRID